jgi:hypothetical protein
MDEAVVAALLDPRLGESGKAAAIRSGLLIPQRCRCGTPRKAAIAAASSRVLEMKTVRPESSSRSTE